jgi:hypothetical protein
MKPRALVAFAVFSLAIIHPAVATEYDYTFTSTTQGTIDFSGTLTTASSADPSLITAMTGIFEGNQLSLAAPGAVTFSPTNNNLFYPASDGAPQLGTTGGLLDFAGLGFSANGTIYNLFSFVSSGGPVLYSVEPNNQDPVAQGTFTVAPVSSVPEPSTSTLMLGGIGILSGLLRVIRGRRRKDQVGGLLGA